MEVTPPPKKRMTLSFLKQFLQLASGLGHSPDFLPSILSLFFWFLLLDPSHYLLPTWSYHQGQHLLPPSVI